MNNQEIIKTHYEDLEYIVQERLGIAIGEASFDSRLSIHRNAKEDAHQACKEFLIAQGVDSRKASTIFSLIWRDLIKGVSNA